MSDIQDELLENYMEMNKLIAKQIFTVGDANKFLERYGNYAIKMDKLEKSRDKWKDKYNQLNKTEVGKGEQPKGCEQGEGK